MVVAMQESIHTARWLSLLEGAGFEITLFPIWDLPVNPVIRDVRVLVPELVPEPACGAADAVRSRPLRGIAKALAHLWSRPAAVEPARRRRLLPYVALRPGAAFSRAWDYLARGPAPARRRTAYVLRYPRRAVLGAIAICCYGVPRSSSESVLRRTPLIVRRPRRALREAGALLRQYARPVRPPPPPPSLPLRPYHVAPAPQTPAGRWQWLRQLLPPRQPVRYAALPLRLAQFGADPRTIHQQEMGDSGEPAATWFGPRVLAEAIARHRPDLIHSMEFQHGAYLVNAARPFVSGPFPRWLASNWGSDIYHFGRFPRHRREILRVLGNLDYYAAECRRDVELARELGYRGAVFPVIPSSGGFDLADCARLRSPGPTSARRVVLVKGYQHFVGRALIAVEILARNADLLRGYEVAVYSPMPEVEQAVRDLQAGGRLDIRCLPKLSHPEMLMQFGRARIYIGLSESDAISTAVLESMVMGTFPIQTNTSCCNEWFADGEGGFIVDLADREGISDRLRRALADDALVDRAAAINWEVAQRRLDFREIRRTVVGAYRELAKATS